MHNEIAVNGPFALGVGIFYLFLSLVLFKIESPRFLFIIYFMQVMLGLMGYAALYLLSLVGC